MGVHLLCGDDETIRRSRTNDLIHELVGDGDRSVMVDEFSGDEFELSDVIDAAQTLPFLTERRVVLARDLERFTVDDLDALLQYLADPLDTTDLVLVRSGRPPKKLSDAVGDSGGVVTNTSPPTRAKDRQSWVRAEAELRGVRIDQGAAARIADQLGEEVGRLEGLLEVLRSTFGEQARVGAADVEPFLGDAGGVPPWDLTDAIDTGATASALNLLARMMHGGERHPLQIMAILHGHYSRLARLDGVDARDDAAAAAAIGIKPGFPAKKARANYQRLGGGNVRRALELLAGADLDLRGRTDLDSETVMEVLVARLSRLGPAGR